MNTRNIEIVRYGPENKDLWNDFVESSKNGTFLFNRDYMDYHSDRFEDFSFLIYRKGKLYCLLPANIQEKEEVKILFSHQGLTYGGLIMSEKCTAEGILEVFHSLLEYLKNEGIRKFIYKPVPYIYHKVPSEEDLYALFRNNARLIVRNISSTVSYNNPLELKKDRKEAIRRAKRNGVYVEFSDDYDSFWQILETNLRETYNAQPVHTSDEIKRLACLFPSNIRLIAAFNKDNEMAAGVVVYLCSGVVHAQYISATHEGKRCGAVDLLVQRLLDIHNETNSIFCEKESEEDQARLKCPLWMDLGTSNEAGGKILNETLIYQKEGFGGRGVCYDTYEIDI